MKEVMALSDRVTVLRDGKVTARLITAESSPEEITHHMTGRDVDLTMAPPQSPPGDTVLAVENLTVAGEGDRPLVDDVSINLRAGEIVGIAGVAGNGQVELAEAIMGLRDITRGSVAVQNNDLTRASVRQRRNAGLTYIPEDRHGVGKIGRASCRERARRWAEAVAR